VTDPTAIGRHVRTKGGLTSLQVRFGVDTVNPKEIRKVVSTVLGHDPDGSDPDAWVAELASWVENNSVLVKRTFKGVSREFDVSLDALEGVLEPAYSGGDTTTSELVEDSVQSEAETFADARKLFAVDGERRRSGNSSPIPSICWRNSTPVRPLPHGCRRPRRVDPYRQRRQ